MKCHSCGFSLDKDLPKEGAVSRGAICPSCSRDIRVCKNCEFFDTNYHNSCRETQAERVTDKEKANFCDYFKISKGPGKLSSVKEMKDKAGNDFDKLFKKDQ